MLQALGLSAGEQDVYEVLVSRPPVTPAELDLIAAARDWQDWRDWGPAALARLVELGLISHAPTDPPCYAVLPPDAVVDRLLAARERELAAARERMIGLAARYHRATEPADHGLVEVGYGKERSVEVFAELSRGARQQLSGCVPPRRREAPADEQRLLEFAGLRRGVAYRVIYDRTSVDGPRLVDVAESVLAGEQARAGEVPFQFMVSDQPLALLPLHADVPAADAFVVVRDPTLVSAVAALFDLLWDRCLPLNVRGGDAAAAATAEPSTAEQDLLRLLVFGMTDREAAEVLGLAERTVRRRLRDMMTKLGATTRFQAGYHAVRRGWLAIGDGRDR